MHATTVSNSDNPDARDEVPVDAYPVSAHFLRVIASFVVLSVIDQLPKRLAEPLSERVIAAIHPPRPVGSPPGKR
ncbi:MAG: hypothetical protein M3O62_09745 [Pseudomonadota bacterium]|nr:hypothetical protein [Pseudomonadota bacterium]